MKIALLSNVTVEVLAGLLRKEHAVWTPSGFGAWMETALEPPEDLRTFAPDLICVLIDRRFGSFDADVQDLDAACARLRERFPSAAVTAPDVARLAADFGDDFYDAKMWTLGKMPFSLKGLRELVKLLSRKKVVAVDLDNTLWKGIVGEDGVDGIVPDRDLQAKLLELKRRGILLVALSKNNADDVEPAWDDPRMLLGKSDFVALAIDWNEKAENLDRIAAELNLGRESFVFVDDRPVERARMRAALPDVAVADFPPQLDVWFPFAAMTDEDAGKTEMYRAESERRKFAARLSVEDYLKGLEIRNEIRPATAADVSRLTQLAQKTNQFNVCTNRLSEGDFTAILDDPRQVLVVARSSDRFGDYGLVAFVRVRLDDAGDAAEIADWVMSCRAMNRRIEFAVEDEVERTLRTRGVRTLRASWKKTARNAPVAELFDGFGFARVAVDEGGRTYSKTLV